MTQYCNLGLNVCQLMGEVNMASHVPPCSSTWSESIAGLLDSHWIWQCGKMLQVGLNIWEGHCLVRLWLVGNPCWSVYMKEDATNMLVYSRLFFLIDGLKKSSKQLGSWRPARISHKFKSASPVYFYSPPKCNIIIRITQISSWDWALFCCGTIKCFSGKWNVIVIK